MVDFGNKIKELRIKAGLTQQELADRLWVTKATISYYEQSQRTPSPEMLIKLAREFHVTTDSLLGLEKERRHIDVTGLGEEDIRFLETTAQMLREKNSRSKVHEKG